MTTQKALAMTPPAFQSIVNKGSPVVLVGQPEPIAFDLSALFGLMDFRSEVRCICSDDVSSTGDQQLLEMRAGDAAQEMCDWQNSRPLIIAHASTAATEYQPIERLLNTHDAALVDFRLEDRPFRVQDWRGPVISADVDVPLALGFEYLYEAPHRFSSFVLSPGQTVIFPPGQIYAYATLSRRVDDDGEVSPGSIMQASYFLAAGCMKRSFFASWLDRSSADQSASEDAWSSTVTTCLMAMVLKAALCRHCQDQEPDECSKLLDEFRDLRIANHAYKVDNLDDTVQKDFDTKASCFRQSMMEAVEKIHPFPPDTQE
ncbi:uncharacterized protein EI90DRAFT_1772527 [Cantharellus anzutake]|uniref:uncharacterized protein n=1 Tax=Cantharellus anzutake TaxID=1750568 RepID=UPI001906FBE8|nr:uncharacterized protein EI90DRAFT_1772527 [Cantharellus anzutake]KAF8327631.1 hypothetical protein EI90DRAFT_1772527 [Cantharellus anzutake]